MRDSSRRWVVARVRLDRPQLTRVIQGEARRALRKRAPQVLNRARILAPVDTGRLRSSGRIEYSGFFTFKPKATIVFDVDYAEAVHNGTRPHIIRPTRAKALRFTIGGRVVYAKVVHHPGTKGKPFLDRALREVLGSAGWNVHPNGV
jgi:hypothetical protein